MRHTSIVFIVLVLVVSAGCAKKNPESRQPQEAGLTKKIDNKQEFEAEMEYKPLQIRLDEKKQEWFRLANQKEVELVENAIGEMQAKEPAGSMLRHDQKAPDFTLQDANGASVNLSALLEKGPVVLVWFWGGWNPYCEITLQALEEQTGRIKDRDGTLLALCPEPADSARAIVKRNGLGFQLLYDKGNAVARKYGLVYSIPAPLADLFRKRYSASLESVKGGVDLPLTSIFVIDKKGMIRYSYGNADYRFRAEPRECVDILDQLKQGILK